MDQEGYLSPVSWFTRKQLTQPDETDAARMAQLLRTVTVRSEQTTQDDVVLQCGAAVSGTVTYDDGAPASGVSVQVLAKDKSGK